MKKKKKVKNLFFALLYFLPSNSPWRHLHFCVSLQDESLICVFHPSQKKKKGESEKKQTRTRTLNKSKHKCFFFFFFFYYFTRLYFSIDCCSVLYIFIYFLLQYVCLFSIFLPAPQIHVWEWLFFSYSKMYF